MNTTTKITKTTTLAILAIAAVGILVSSTAVAKPALAKSSNDGNSVSRSNIRDVGKFLQCIASHGGNDVSKRDTQRCIDNYLGGNNNNNNNNDHNNDNNSHNGNR
jgi:hypothetical protein